MNDTLSQRNTTGRGLFTADWSGGGKKIHHHICCPLSWDNHQRAYDYCKAISAAVMWLPPDSAAAGQNKAEQLSFFVWVRWLTGLWGTLSLSLPSRQYAEEDPQHRHHQGWRAAKSRHGGTRGPQAEKQATQVARKCWAAEGWTSSLRRDDVTNSCRLCRAAAEGSGPVALPHVVGRRLSLWMING